MNEETFSVPPNGDVDQGLALVVVAFVSTVTRIWIRARVTRNLGWDDFFILLAMVSNPCTVNMKA